MLSYGLFLHLPVVVGMPVPGDPEQPGGKIAVARVGGAVPEDALKHILDQVGADVAARSQSVKEPEQALVIAFKQYRERVEVAVFHLQHECFI